MEYKKESGAECAHTHIDVTWRVMCVCVYFACLAVVCVTIIILLSPLLTE